MKKRLRQIVILFLFVVAYSSFGNETEIGLRAYDGTDIIDVAVDADDASHKLKIHKDGTTYGVILVETTHSYASQLHIETGEGVKALKKRDTTAPTVELTDDHPDSIVRFGDAILITAEFIELDAIDETVAPSITIGTIVVSESMTRSTNLIWTYSWVVPAGNDGVVTLSISATDVAGNANAAATGKTSYTIDNTPPASPSPPDLAAGDDTGISSDDNITASTVNLTFSGNGEVGAEVILYSDIDGALNLPAQVDVSGNWSIDASLTENIHTVTAIQSDGAGNASVTSLALSVTVDTTAPALTQISIISTNADPSLAKVGDEVTIIFALSENLVTTPAVTIDGNDADHIEVNASGDIYSAGREMQAGDTDGIIAFTIDITDAAGNGSQASASTDGTNVIFDSTDHTGSIQFASRTVSEISTGESGSPSVSDDGNWVLFLSEAQNLAPDNPDYGLDYFLSCAFMKNMVTGSIQRVSFDLDGQPIWARSPSMSADGRYVAFVSEQVYLYDRVTGDTTLVSVRLDGNPAGQICIASQISSNGRYVAFTSYDALAGGSEDSAGDLDIFIRDLVLQQTYLVTKNYDSSDVFSDLDYTYRDPLYYLSVSDNGELAFSSIGNVFTNDPDDYDVDVFIYSLASDTFERIPKAFGNIYLNEGSTDPSLSRDGRFVAFTAYYYDGSLPEPPARIFVFDRNTGDLAMACVTSAGTEFDEACREPFISGDGRYVSFVSEAVISASDSGGFMDVFVHDRITGTTQRISVSGEGAEGNGASGNPYGNYSWGVSLSYDGRYAAFSSEASNFVLGDTNDIQDVFVKELTYE